MKQSTQRKIRIGIIGAGNMGSNHVHVLKEFCSHLFTITAICEPHGPYLDEVKAGLPDSVVFDSGMDLIKSDLIDAIIISTPNYTHKDFVISALSANKHVLCEKPVATTLEDINELVQASIENDCIYMIGHELRYDRYYEVVNELVEKEVIGKIVSVWCQEFRRPFLKKVDDWIQDERKSGGALTDKNCHHFDLMNWWVKSRPRTVFAMGGTDVVRVIHNSNEVIDNASVVLDYENNVRGTLQLCMFGAPNPDQGSLRMGLIGTKGQMELNIKARKIIANFRDSNETLCVSVPSNPEKWISHDGFVEEHEAFFHAINHGLHPLTHIQNCADATRIAIAAELSIKKNQPVLLLNN